MVCSICPSLKPPASTAIPPSSFRLKESIKDGGGGGDIADEFAPFLDGPIGGHDRGSRFVAAHDDLEEVFARLRG